ncbi:Uncharacterised protein [uncultured archaeon]|nr:Uncharacterised protein [uncultured archaeon]
MGCSCGTGCDEKHPFKSSDITTQLAYGGIQRAQEQLRKYILQLSKVIEAPNNQADINSALYYFFDQDWRLGAAAGLLKNAKDSYSLITAKPLDKLDEFIDVEKTMIYCLEEKTNHLKKMINKGEHTFGAQRLLKEIERVYESYSIEPPKGIRELTGNSGMTLDEIKRLHPELNWERKGVILKSNTK